MHRSLLLAIPLLLASLAAPALAQPGPPGYRAHLDLNSAMTADTDLIDAPGSDTDLVVYASSGAKTVTSFSATISLVSTASKVYVVRKQGATTVRSWLNNGDEVPAGTDVELVWKAYSGWTYNLQVETTTSGSLIVCEVSNAVSVAGLRRSGGGGGLSSVSTTGDALSGAGTSGDPLSAAADLENLVDTLAVSSGGAVSWASGLGAITHLSGPSDQAFTLGGATGQSLVLKVGSQTLATLNDTPDFTFGTGVGVKGGGSAAMGGFLRPVLSVATTQSLSSSMSGWVVTDDNTDNGNVCTPALPSATAGLCFYFWCSLVDANDGMVITAASGDTITDLGTSGTAGTLTATVSNSAAVLVALDDTRWVLISGNGGWTTSAP